jgi:hypothetical protein
MRGFYSSIISMKEEQSCDSDFLLLRKPFWSPSLRRIRRMRDVSLIKLNWPENKTRITTQTPKLCLVAESEIWYRGIPFTTRRGCRSSPSAGRHDRLRQGSLRSIHRRRREFHDAVRRRSVAGSDASLLSDARPRGGRAYRRGHYRSLVRDGASPSDSEVGRRRGGVRRSSASDPASNRVRRSAPNRSGQRSRPVVGSRRSPGGRRSLHRPTRPPATPGTERATPSVG